ncbi:hypothetical protein CON65_12200 [Bacillus pseudomycoides]|uniref:Uncharacterized protein n=1 Tax=Bacillus pseudomycoides TaxID=64104 RepID=A0AA91VBV2_9BACI|nr:MULTISPECIES: ETX/MTX2 family pore-forming toxin [Bacillus]PEB50326.1 hypothetical protein COO03_22870 [Bacillus sp. AFS098217]PED82396.1 hypothetical protein CON65_12200 [Bacillus pseudomycoides]PEU05860.1 hypothetical protein CN524_24670 [Bacillus sp. AFS019443]PEU17790.1 hypothetical protein CN525_13845 [Bacillus sp. AFS014408]PFW63103.1 hypothetical protein COL20_10030 [Bacillus sp. AFS075034]
MKKYKKLLMVAPLACMLGTGAVALPNAVHAAESLSSPASFTNIYDDGTSYTKETLEKDLYKRILRGIENTPELRQKFKLADDEGIQREKGASSLTDPNGNTTEYPAINYGLMDQLSKVEAGIVGSHFDVNPTVDSYEDLGQTNLLTINNDDGTVAQTAQTPETTEKFSESMSYSNSTGMKLGIGSSTTVKVKIPFDLGEVSQTVNINSEFSFNNTVTNTSTHEKSVTFKSQPVVAAPGGTTTYYGSIKRAKFSGTIQTDAYLAGVTLKLPIVKKNGNSYDIVHTEEVTLTPEDMYAIFKNGLPVLPPYLSFDDENKKVKVNNAPFTFSGEGGYYSAVKVKFTPKDSNKSPQEMPYKEYVAKAQQGAL